MKRNRFITLTGAQKSVNRELEAKARTLAGWKGYITNLANPTPEYVIGAYHQLWQVEKSFRMSKSDLKARPVYHHLKDSIGRSWQCGTMQVDFQMPGRLGAEYVGEDNTRQVPVMLHRAIVGSLERFIGILIEHHAGAFPAWLAPVQAVVLTITDRQAPYAREVVARLKAAGLRVQADLRNEKITYKIREHSLQKLPVQLIVGDKEVEAKTVAVRSRSGEDLGAMSLEALIARLGDEVAARR